MEEPPEEEQGRPRRKEVHLLQLDPKLLELRDVDEELLEFADCAFLGAKAIPGDVDRRMAARLQCQRGVAGDVAGRDLWPLPTLQELQALG